MKLKPKNFGYASLRGRIAWCMAGLAILAALGAGFAGVQSAGRALDRGFADESIRNAARLIEELRLPPSTRLAEQLGQIFGAHVLFLEGEDRRVLGSDLEKEDAERIAGSNQSRVEIEGETFRRIESLLGTGDKLAICLLTPEKRLRRARRRALAPVISATLLAALLTTLLATRLAATIAGPVILLANDCETFSQRIAAPEWGRAEENEITTSPPELPGSTAPAEVRRLAEAFAKLSEELNQSRNRLLDSARLVAVGRLAASIAHELRNPLSGIAMNARVLAERQKENGETDPSLALILREISRLDDSLEELLAIASAGTSGRRKENCERECEAVDVSTLAKGVSDLLELRFQETGVRFIRSLDQEAILHCNPRDIRRILLNLLLNALDLTPQGGEVSIELEHDREQLRLRVRDTGPGLPEGIDIFAPFISTRPGGTGLGLAVARRLAELNGGTLTAENRLGGGAEFVLILPV